jgi:hypothetical protein
MTFTLIPIISSTIPLSVSPFLGRLFPMIPMTVKPFRCNRFGFVPERFTVHSRHFYHDLSTVKASIALPAPHRSVVAAIIGLVIQKVRIFWVPIRGARAEFPDHTLALSSCDTGRVDQLSLDCLYFKAGTLLERDCSGWVNWDESITPRMNPDVGRSSWPKLYSLNWNQRPKRRPITITASAGGGHGGFKRSPNSRP